MSTVRIEKHGDYHFSVSFKYSGDKDVFFGMLKSFKVAIDDKKWVPEEKVWEVPITLQKELLAWCLNSGYYDSVYFLGELYNGTTSQKPPPNNGNENSKKAKDAFEDFGSLDGKDNGKKELYATLYLTPNAPKELIDFVWKKLMVIYHPDKGGDGAIASAINSAYQKIKGGKV